MSMTDKLKSTRREYSERISRDILRAMEELTPPSCRVCTAREIMTALLRLDYKLLTVRRITGHLGVLRKRGLVEGRLDKSLQLWLLTRAGRARARDAL
jgi:DNA-binding transcriptional ArsR family regulator